MTQEIGACFPDQQSGSEVHHQDLGLKECHSNLRPDSGTQLPTSPILNQGERVVTNTGLWDTLSNQLSHIHHSVFFPVSAYVCFIFNWLIYYF
jgi:hypothetical protein